MVLPECTWQLIIVHIVFVLPKAPEAGYLFSVDEFELAFVVRPRNYMSMLVGYEQLEQELPQRNIGFHAWNDEEIKTVLARLYNNNNEIVISFLIHLVYTERIYNAH